jgi:hypothetical protein
MTNGDDAPTHNIDLGSSDQGTLPLSSNPPGITTDVETIDRQVDFKEISMNMISPQEYVIAQDVIPWLMTYIRQIGASILRLNIFTRDHTHRPVEVGSTSLVPASLLLQPDETNVIHCSGGTITISTEISLSTGLPTVNMLTWRPTHDVITHVLDRAHAHRIWV